MKSWARYGIHLPHRGVGSLDVCPISEFKGLYEGSSPLFCPVGRVICEKDGEPLVDNAFLLEELDTGDVCQEKIKPVVLCALIFVEEALLGLGFIFQLHPVTYPVDIDEDI